MTYEEFKNHLQKSLNIAPNNYGFGDIKDEDIIGIRWIIGGLGGGSCWGDKADIPVTSEQQPEFVELDLILEEFYENITFLQYKKLCQLLIKSDTYSEDGYYGNYSEYARKWISLKDLYNYLKEILTSDFKIL